MKKGKKIAGPDITFNDKIVSPACLKTGRADIFDALIALIEFIFIVFIVLIFSTKEY